MNNSYLNTVKSLYFTPNTITKNITQLSKCTELPMMVENTELPMLVENTELPMVVENNELPVVVENTELPMVVENNELPMVVENTELPVPILLIRGKYCNLIQSQNYPPVSVINPLTGLCKTTFVRRRVLRLMD